MSTIIRNIEVQTNPFTDHHEVICDVNIEIFDFGHINEHLVKQKIINDFLFKEYNITLTDIKDAFPEKFI